MTSQLSAHEGAADPLVQAHQNEQTIRRNTGWMGASLLVQLHTWQRRYVSLIASPPDSQFPQLHFNLTDATHWMPHYNGFSYEEFYEFIIDFFEADTTPEGQEASAILLEWWNRYFSVFTPTPPAADMRDVPRAVFPRSAATRAAAPSSTRRASLAVLRQQRQATHSSNP